MRRAGPVVGVAVAALEGLPRGPQRRGQVEVGAARRRRRRRRSARPGPAPARRCSTGARGPSTGGSRCAGGGVRARARARSGSARPRGTAPPAGRPRSSRRTRTPRCRRRRARPSRSPTAGCRCGRLARQLAPVRVVGVPVRRRARVAHHLISGSGVDGRVALRRRAMNDAKATATAASHTTMLGFAGSRPSTQTATRFANVRSRNCPPRSSERVSTSARKAGSSASNPISGLWNSSQRVGLDGAGLVVRAGDRLRVDLVAEVGELGGAAGDQGVRDRLQGRVREVRPRPPPAGRPPGCGPPPAAPTAPARRRQHGRALEDVAAGQQSGDLLGYSCCWIGRTVPIAILPRLWSRRFKSTRPGYYPEPKVVEHRSARLGE